VTRTTDQRPELSSLEKPRSIQSLEHSYRPLSTIVPKSCKHPYEYAATANTLQTTSPTPRNLIRDSCHLEIQDKTSGHQYFQSCKQKHTKLQRTRDPSLSMKTVLCDGFRMWFRGVEREVFERRVRTGVAQTRLRLSISLASVQCFRVCRD
jgi:hypothetical protein